MTDKPFSPIKSSDVQILTINSSTYKGAEWMFSDSRPFLNVMILRSDANTIITSEPYYIIDIIEMVGFNNGTDYDYRIDFSNYIKMKYPSTITMSGYSQHVNVIDLDYFGSNIMMCASTGDPLVENASLITTLSNGQMFVNNTSLLVNLVIYRFFMLDRNYTQYIFINDLYLNSKFIVNLGASYSYKVKNLSFYDSFNNLISDYGTSTEIQGIDYKFRSVLFDVPTNAHKMIITTSWSDFDTITTKYVSDCAKNQYFFIDNYNSLSSIICTGKRETIYDVEKETIKISNKTKNLKIYRQKRYSQNTGLHYKEQDIYNLLVSPFIFEIINNFWIVRYRLQNNSVEGYNTKKLSARNFVLDLARDNKQQIYVDFENNFYN